MLAENCKFVDFITVLDLAARTDPYAEITFMDLYMSKLINKKDIRSIEMEFNGVSGFGGIERRTCDYGSFQFGGFEHDMARFTQRELFEEIKNNIGADYVGAIIKKRNLFEVISGQLNDVEGLDGAESLLVEQRSRGNHAKMVKKQFGVPVIDPIEKTKNMIISKGFINEDNEDLLFKMRSNQVSNGIYLDGELGLSPRNSYQVFKLLADRWSKDVATLSSLYSHHDFGQFSGQVYHLRKMEGDVVL